MLGHRKGANGCSKRFLKATDYEPKFQAKEQHYSSTKGINLESPVCVFERRWNMHYTRKMIFPKSNPSYTKNKLEKESGHNLRGRGICWASPARGPSSPLFWVMLLNLQTVRPMFSHAISLPSTLLLPTSRLSSLRHFQGSGEALGSFLLPGVPALSLLGSAAQL